MAALFPGSDAKLLEWSTTFNAGLSANFASLGMTSAQAASYTTVHNAFATALAAATTPATRTSITIAQKDLAKKNLKHLGGGYAMMLQGNPSVSNAQREALGLKPRVLPTPIPPPSTSPVIEIKGVTGWKVSIKLKSANGSHRGRPPLVSQAVVFSYIGATPPADITKWVYQGQTNKLLCDVQFPSTLASGTTVWLSAQWLNAKGESGPATFPVSTVLQGGNVIQQAA